MNGAAARRDSPVHTQARPKLGLSDGRRAVLAPPFAAELLDHHLQHLASHEARCRLTLGRLAQVLLDQRVYRELGFVRVGDYTRERLGLSARQLQSLAQVARSLPGHPELTRAFEAGEISWTQLRRRIGAVDGVCPSAEAGADAARDAQADDDDLIEGEPAVEFRLPCPPSLRFLWRQAVELASRASGSPLAYWQAAEVIAAEALTIFAGGEQQAGAGADLEFVSAAASAAGSTAGFAEGSIAALTAGDPLAAAPTEQPAACRDEDAGLCAEALQPGTPPRSFFLNVGLPADLAQLTQGLSSIGAHELDARLRRVVAAMQSLDWQTGRLLRTLFGLRLHRELGFSSTSLYIRSRLQIGVRKARGLVAIERATRLCCLEFSRAYRRGKISWLRALAILPVLSQDSGPLWVERAARVTLRRLHDEVTWTLNRADASAGRCGLRPPALGAAIDTLDCDLAAALDADDTGGSGDTGDSSESATALHFGAHCCGNGSSFSSVTIRFFGPPTVVALLHEALEHTKRPGEPRWRAMQRLLCAVMNEWNALPRHRDPVFARDGWRCTVPACSSRRSLEDHHLVFRSRGGDNRLANRVAVCAWHHRHAIHDRRLLAARSKSGALHWQLGIGAAGRPLMEFLGDVYLYGAPGAASAPTTMAGGL